MVDTDDEQVLTEVCWAIYNLVDVKTEHFPELLNEDVVNRLLQNFKLVGNVAIVAPSMRVVGNMLNGTTREQQMVLDCNLAMSLSYVIDHSDALV